MEALFCDTYKSNISTAKDLINVDMLEIICI